MRDYFYLFLYKSFKFISNLLPNWLIDIFCSFLAFLFYHFDKKHTKIIRSNLKFCFPSWDKKKIEDTIKNTYKNFAIFGFDFLKNKSATKEDIIKKTHFLNIDVLKNLLKLNRPIIIQTAHFSNWELFALSFAARFNNTAIIGRDLDSALMNEILKDYRKKFNMRVFSKKGNTKDIIKWLKDGNMLGILVDQNTSLKDGIEISFFNKRATHTAGASNLAIKLNAIILPSFIRKKDNKTYEIKFFDPIFVDDFKNDVKKITQAQVDATEEMIKSSPSEYFWMHKRFKEFNKEIYD